MIRVIIERYCKPGKGSDLEKLISDLRMKAIPVRGFSSGETLKSVDNPDSYVVISTWFSPEQWKSWHSSPERRAIAQQINPLLGQPEKISIFNFVG